MARLITFGFFILSLFCFCADSIAVQDEACSLHEFLRPCGKTCEPDCDYSTVECNIMANCPLECACMPPYKRYKVTGECVKKCPPAS